MLTARDWEDAHAMGGCGPRCVICQGDWSALMDREHDRRGRIGAAHKAERKDTLAKLVRRIVPCGVLPDPACTACGGLGGWENDGDPRLCDCISRWI